MLEKIRKFLDVDSRKIHKQDIICIFIIVFFYSLLSFINLGDFKVPNTFVDFKKDDILLVKLNKSDTIDKLKIFGGEKDFNFDLYVSNDDVHYTMINTIKGDGSFSWRMISIDEKIKYFKFVFLDDSTIGEIACTKGLKNNISIKKVSANGNVVKKLTDEGNTVPVRRSYKNSSYFDEIYFARTAYEYTKNKNTFEWTHPPLGKMLQSIPILLTHNMSPFFYRFMGNFAGIIMIVVMYLFGLELFYKRKYAVLSSLLMCFDTFHFAMTRIGTSDSFLVLFILLSIFFMIKFINYSYFKYLFLSGLFFGCSISVKWIGFLGGFALAIMFFSYLLYYKKIHWKYFFAGFLFFVIVPSVIYCSLYLFYPKNEIYYTNNLENIVKQQKYMFEYHSNLKESHPFSSKWYTWPIGYRPVWLFKEVISNNRSETISTVPNVVIWWVGIVSVLYLLVYFFKKKDKRAFLLLVCILSLWLPYIKIGRVMFLYHYFEVIPFLILATVFIFETFHENKIKKFLIITYLLFSFLFFVIYYPVVSGLPVNNQYIDSIKLFSSWNF